MCFLVERVGLYDLMISRLPFLRLWPFKFFGCIIFVSTIFRFLRFGFITFGFTSVVYERRWGRWWTPLRSSVFECALGIEEAWSKYDGQPRVGHFKILSSELRVHYF